MTEKSQKDKWLNGVEGEGSDKERSLCWIWRWRSFVTLLKAISEKWWAFFVCLCP